MSGNIVVHQGELLYQEGDRVTKVQRRDLAEQFLLLCEGVERGLASQQECNQAFALLLRKEREAQSELVQAVTGMADTVVLTANKSTDISVAAFNRLADLLEKQIEANEKIQVESSRAIAASQPKEFYISTPWYMWLTGEHALVLSIALFVLFTVGIAALNLIDRAQNPQPQRSSLPVGGVTRVY